jgi:DinB superfamily
MDEIQNAIIKLNDALDYFCQQDLKLINWDDKPAADKWSKKQIIGHLIDSAQVNLQRFVRCTYEEKFKLIYEQEQWVKAQRYQDADIDKLLILWKSINDQIIRSLEGYPTDRAHIQCDTGKKKVSLHTVSWLALDYVEHLKHHLQQII